MSESIERIDTSSGRPADEPVVPTSDPPADVPPATIPTAPVESAPKEQESKEEEKAPSESKQSKRKPRTTTKRETKASVPPIKVPDPSPEPSVDRASPEKKTKVIEKPEKYDHERWKQYQAYHSMSIRQIRGSIDSINRQWANSRTGR